MTIYSDCPGGKFKPTFLYIKRHTITGLKYFGKTTTNDPIRYQGSGTYWTRHIKKHGPSIETLWYQLFTDKEELKKFALNFSKENNIVESLEWANLKPEDGLRGGGVKGIKIKPHTLNHKKKISDGVRRTNANQGKQKKPKQLKGRSKGGWKWSEQDKKEHSMWQIGVPKRRMCCIHCKTEGGVANILQWHGDKCKMNPVKNIE